MKILIARHFLSSCYFPAKKIVSFWKEEWNRDWAPAEKTRSVKVKQKVKCHTWQIDEGMGHNGDFYSFENSYFIRNSLLVNHENEKNCCFIFPWYNGNPLFKLRCPHMWIYGSFQQTYFSLSNWSLAFFRIFSWKINHKNWAENSQKILWLVPASMSQPMVTASGRCEGVSFL